MKNMWGKFTVFCLIISTAACSGQRFGFKKLAPQIETSNGIYFFPYSKTSEYFKQSNSNQNIMSLIFRVTDEDGFSVTGLSPSDFIITENGQVITDLDLSTDKPQTGVDIVFVIDETNSMSNIINTVKANVTSFVNNLSSKRLKANLCLVTFKDVVTRTCTRIIEDNPATAVNENVQAFLNDLSNIVASGGQDTPENQLDGIQQAILQTPWHTNYQKSVILITNSDFHYSPGNEGDAGSAAPVYQNVLQLAQIQNVMSFVIGTDDPGYSKNFQGLPSIPMGTDGEYFSISRVLSNASEMDSILSSIADKLAVNYTISYAADENGLDPALPLSSRNITVQLKTPLPGSTIKISSTSSTFPNGTPLFQTSWVLNGTAPILSNTLEVLINNTPTLLTYSLQSGSIVFSQPPPANSDIVVMYELQGLRNNIQIQPIFTKPTPLYYSFKVKFNNIIAQDTDVRITTTIDGQNVIEPQSTVFDDTDPYKIRENGGLLLGFEMIFVGEN